MKALTKIVKCSYHDVQQMYNCIFIKTVNPIRNGGEAATSGRNVQQIQCEKCHVRFQSVLKSFIHMNEPQGVDDKNDEA